MKFASMLLLLAGVAFTSGRVFALGVDIGPVHVHGTKVKIGEETTLRIVVDKLKYDEDKKVVKEIKAHRKGDSDDKFEIKVDKEDLNDESKEVLAKIKEDKRYRMTLKKLDEGWRLLKIKVDEED
ncbi:MAG: hypothetical protein NTW87_29525 [Planctomycetota bacterium]|nr:hypothetical protein [Planctomycetota bacterium]